MRDAPEREDLNNLPRLVEKIRGFKEEWGALGFELMLNKGRPPKDPVQVFEFDALENAYLYVGDLAKKYPGVKTMVTRKISG